MIDLTWSETPYLAIDTETTGFSREDRICEIAIILARQGKIIRVFHSLVNPKRAISEGARAVHGISDEDVENSPEFYEIRPQVLDMLRMDVPWVAHQMNFDARMLSYVIPREEWPRGVPTLCTMEFAKKHHPSLRMRAHHKLLDVAGALQINYDPEAAHNALNDADILMKIVPEMMGGRPVANSYTKLSEEWLKD